MLLQAGLAFGQAPGDSITAPSDSTRSVASCWAKVSHLDRGKEILLYDSDRAKYKGDIERVRDDPPLLSLKVYDASQSRFVIHDFSAEAVKRIEYRSSEMALPIIGAATLGFLGYWAGKSWDDDPDNGSYGSSSHLAIGGTVFGVLIGGVIGMLVSPSSHHVIECP
jgi:hypothetical protein